MSGVPSGQYRLTLIACAVSLILACAQVGGPPGGEPDRTPPKMLSSEPPTGSVEVPISDRIIIHFSEAVQPGTGRQIYVSPRPRKEPKLKWKSDRLEVIFPDTFVSNQTYVVQVSSSVSDLRNNHLDSAIIVAFSTGPTLDSGHVAGVVTLNGTPAAGTLVGLYEASAAGDSLRYDSISAGYMALSNAKGAFEFKYLPRKLFQLIAWTDRNRDEKLNPLIESYGVTDRPIDLRTQNDFAGLSIALRTVDTSKPQILALSYTANRLVRARLSRPIRPDQLSRNLNLISLWPSGDSTRPIHPTGLLERDDTAAASLTLAVPPLADTSYAVEVKYDSTLPALSSKLSGVKTQADKEKPTVVKFLPASDKPIFVEDVKIGLVVSEPLDTTRISATSFSLKIPPSESPTLLQRQWRDPFHLDFVPQRLLEGKQYAFTIVDSDLTDLAGNRVGDSTSIHRFTTVNPDSLGMITGKVTVQYEQKPNSPAVLTFKEISGKYSLTRAFQNRLFHVDLPAGKYLLSGYLDDNRNGVRDLGSVWPMRFSETSASSADTVVVRARFETAEVEFIIK